MTHKREDLAKIIRDIQQAEKNKLETTRNLQVHISKFLVDQKLEDLDEFSVAEYERGKKESEKELGEIMTRINQMWEELRLELEDELSETIE